MSTDTPDPNASVFDTPKGGLYGGFFDPSGLDPNVQAVMMDYRWTTSFDGPTAATRITYSFPHAAVDYTVAPGYPAAENVATFAPLTAAQMAAARTGFDLVASYTQVTFVEVASGMASDATFRFARFDDGGSESEFPSNDGAYSKADSRNAADSFLGGNGIPRPIFSEPTTSTPSSTRWGMRSASNMATIPPSTGRSRRNSTTTNSR